MGMNLLHKKLARFKINKIKMAIFTFPTLIPFFPTPCELVNFPFEDEISQKLIVQILHVLCQKNLKTKCVYGPKLKHEN